MRSQNVVELGSVNLPCYEDKNRLKFSRNFAVGELRLIYFDSLARDCAALLLLRALFYEIVKSSMANSVDSLYSTHKDRK